MSIVETLAQSWGTTPLPDELGVPTTGTD
jgi:hypothetical protein